MDECKSCGAEIKRAENAEKAAIRIYERFRDRCGWCRDYKECRHNRDWDACNKISFITTVEQVEKEDKEYDALHAERDYWKTRAETLERALSGFCIYCKRAEKAFPDLPNSSLVTCDSLKKRKIKGVAGRGGKNCPDWQFDEARFAVREPEEKQNG